MSSCVILSHTENNIIAKYIEIIQLIFMSNVFCCECTGVAAMGNY